VNRQTTRILLAPLLLFALAFAGCDSSTQPASPTATTGQTSSPTATFPLEGPIPVPSKDGTPGAISGPTIGSAEPGGSPATPPTPSGTIVDTSAATLPSTPGEAAPTPTPVTATGSGEALTALQALDQLKPKALAWQKDARLGLLSNIRPGQQKSLLGTTLGDPNVNEPTPDGKGRNWTLIAFSPSANGAAAISTDGTQTDLVSEDAVTEEVLTRFNAPHLSALNLSALNSTQLVDSDVLFRKMGARSKSQTIGIALLAPDGLGLGPLPTPSPSGDSPQLAYEAFSTDPNQQTFIFFDAKTGNVILDSSAP